LASKEFRHKSWASKLRRKWNTRPVRKNLPKYRASLLIALAWSPVSVFRGQEALRSALSADAAIASQSATNAAPTPDALHIGPVKLNLGTYAGMSFEDNINVSQNNPRSDTSIHAGLDLGFLWPATDSSRLQFDSQIGYVTYLAHTRSDSIEIAPNSALTWNISFEDGSLALYDQFDYSQEVITVPSVSGLNSLPRLNNTIGVRAQWLPGKWLLEAGVSHNDFLATDSAFDYLDSASEYFFARGARRFTDKTDAGLEFSAGQTDYRLSVQQNNRSYSVGPYLDWNVTEFFSASVRGGPTIYSFESNGPGQPSKTLTAYYFNLDLTHRLTEFISHELSAKREVNLGLNRGNDYNEQLSVNYAIHWAATQNADLSLGLAYEQGTQPLTIDLSPVTENFARFGVSSGVNYRLTENLGGSLNFSHWERTSNLNGNNYIDNIVSFQMTYHF
jgi:hypothetical protein